VLWIRIGFNAHPDPFLYMNADLDTDPDPGSQTNADPDPDPGQTVKSQKFEFLHEKYTSIGIGQKTYLRRLKKPF
jgi:hypothetical protein